MLNILKKHYDLTIILSILLVVFIFMVTISYTFAFFFSNKSITGTIILGELDYDVVIVNNQNDNIMPGDNVDVNIKIVNAVNGKSNLVPFYFRFKFLCGDNIYDKELIHFIHSNNYICDDEYCYYKYKVETGETVNILDYIMIDSALTQNESEHFNISITIDAVQSEYDAYKDVFNDAPEEWILFIENN